MISIGPWLSSYSGARMGRLLVVCGLLLLSASPGWADASKQISAMRNAVVRIHAVAQIPDYRTPWRPGRITQGTGSGFLIAHRMILTNAHVASNARLLSVEKEGDSRRYEAQVKHIAHDCDLALLTVSDSSFFVIAMAGDGFRIGVSCRQPFFLNGKNGG